MWGRGGRAGGAGGACCCWKLEELDGQSDADGRFYSQFWSRPFFFFFSLHFALM